jgi:hypothetical protein
MQLRDLATHGRASYSTASGRFELKLVGGIAIWAATNVSIAPAQQIENINKSGI